MGNIDSALPVLEVEKKPEKGESEEEESDSSSEEETRKPKKVKVKVDNSWKQSELKDLGLKLTFKNKEDALAINECKIEKWSMDERNKQIEEILTEKNEFIASDIYHVTGPKVTLTENVTVVVKLGKDISKRHKVKVKMHSNGSWKNEDATFKKNSAEFKTTQVEDFVIVGDLVTKKVKIPPEGMTVKVDDTSKMEVEIPAGAVDTDQELDFQIIPPDATAMEKYLTGEDPMCKSVVGVTECIYGESSKAITFKKPVTVKLPFENKPVDDDVTLVMFRMVGNEITMMDRSTEIGMNEGNVCNLQVSAFSGYIASYVRNDALDDPKTIESEIRLLFGKNYIAKILIFRERKNMPTGFPKLWVEIVDKVNVEKVVEKRTQVDKLVELQNSRSQDIKVFDGYRMRIDIVGNLKGLRDIPKSYYLLTYLDVADDNHKMFTVEKKGEVHTSIGIINFYCDKGPHRRCVHSVQMDTVVGFDKVYRTDHESGPRQKRLASGGDEASLMSGFSGHASSSSIGNDAMSMATGVAGYQETQPNQLVRQNSSLSIGSATSLMSQAPLCPALNEGSLYNMAEMIKQGDNGMSLSAQLGMSDNYDTISESSQSQRAAVFKLLKEWTKKQTTTDDAVEELTSALKAAKLKKVAEAFKKAVKKNTSV
ncbi:uncharacterized protein LOC124141600 [Haliotis rufescens]|uniref:uncharacterized protein LOC124141600 n=1 Tax=Haliotis rufescens TaxID=6454 RepID=UPI001EB02851|nr:uncharacterized protein LOC124141600 [Haliotis rufescens]XP_046365581.1 uncharacterized protein LOC124141600 [Haliotis rufescens]XP_046365582.1 uncharacterized protein LOC124141600 [Haliotis rufescens]XP_048239192.1 uncharacterized protein LOC124141600 [Haliotis rufescens]